MKLLLLFSFVAVGAVVYPRYAEHSDDVCGAFAKRLEALMRTAQLPSPAGSYNDLANAFMRAQYPQVPAALRCTAGYWMTVVNPDVTGLAQRVLALMLPGSPPR
jgi:hypothetical protein